MSSMAKHDRSVASEIIDGLTELRDTLRQEKPIEERFTVRTVELDLRPHLDSITAHYSRIVSYSQARIPDEVSQIGGEEESQSPPQTRSFHAPTAHRKSGR